MVKAALEYCSVYAYTFVAVYGLDFKTAGKMTLDLFRVSVPVHACVCLRLLPEWSVSTIVFLVLTPVPVRPVAGVPSSMTASSAVSCLRGCLL